MRTVIIDADVLVYQSALRVEKPINWYDDFWTLHADEGEARQALEEHVHDIADGLAADKIIMALSDYTDPWRKAVMPTYKSHRKKVRRPVVFEAMRAFVRERYETFQRPSLEGDDVLGILATHPTLLPGEKVIVTIDKDLQSVPCLYVNLADVAKNNGDYEASIRRVSVAEADRFHMLQTLAGDPVDGYSGCPGLGMKRAAELLDSGYMLTQHEHTLTRGPRKGEKEIRWEPNEDIDCTPWDIVVSAYAAAGLSEEVALQTARVARICRARDYDYTNKRVILWSPPHA